MSIAATTIVICGLLGAEGADFQPIYAPERTFAPSDVRSALQMRKLARQVVDSPAHMSMLTQLAKMAAEMGPEGLQKLDPEKFPQVQKMAEQLARDPALRERLMRDEKLRDIMEKMVQQMKPAPKSERRDGAGLGQRSVKPGGQVQKGSESFKLPDDIGSGSLSIRPERISGTPEPQIVEAPKPETKGLDAEAMKLLQDSLSATKGDAKENAGNSGTEVLEEAAKSVLGEQRSDPTSVGKLKSLAQSMRNLGGPFAESDALEGAIEKLDALQKRSVRFQNEEKSPSKSPDSDVATKKGGKRGTAGKNEGPSGNDPLQAMLPGEGLIDDARPGKKDSSIPGRRGSGFGERLAESASRVPLPGFGDEPSKERESSRRPPRTERKAAAPISIPQLPKFNVDPLRAIAKMDPKQLIPTPRTAYSLIAFGVVGFVAAMLARYILDRPHDRNRRRQIASSVKLLHRESLSVRERVARAFEQLAIAIVGEPALTQHHRRLAEQLTPFESDSAAPARQAARELADYYELARYSPPETPAPEGMIIAVEERCRIVADSANSIVPSAPAPTVA